MVGKEEMTVSKPLVRASEKQPLDKNITSRVTQLPAKDKLVFQEVHEKIKELLHTKMEYFPQNDIGASRLFYQCYENEIVYVHETKCWYLYNGKVWEKDESNLRIMERMKEFVLEYAKYALHTEEQDLIKYTARLCNRSRRESVMKDASSISPQSLRIFDGKKHLLNCKNGTYNLKTNQLQEHNSLDYITKIANVNYRETAICDRWIRFISEIMKEDEESSKFLQKSFGYGISGETNLECFFIFYGSSTRNGKSTTCETISYLLGDYAINAQAKTVAKNNRDGSAATPDIARLKGARFVTMAELEKGLEIDVSLIKQLTGGDRYTGRFLNENPIEFVPEFKIFINTNHLPCVNDDTIFSSDRVKILPFERHFSLEEQDIGLKQTFQEELALSGIFNWLIQGYQMLQMEGLTTPETVLKATVEYREESDTIGTFLRETVCTAKENRLPTVVLYRLYKEWSVDNGYRALYIKNFLGEIRKTYEIKRNGVRGNEIIGINLLPKYIPKQTGVTNDGKK